MDSWANLGSRDLHLDLRQAITPGARGARELLLSALRDAVRSGRLTPGTMLPPSRSLAADLGLARNTVAEAYAELVAEGWLASRQGGGTWGGNVRRTGGPRSAREAPRDTSRTDAQPDARLARRGRVSAQRMGGRRSPGTDQRAHRGAADGRPTRAARASRRARGMPCQGARRAHVARDDRDLRRRPTRGPTVGT